MTELTMVAGADDGALDHDAQSLPWYVEAICHDGNSALATVLLARQCGNGIER